MTNVTNFAEDLHDFTEIMGLSAQNIIFEITWAFMMFELLK